MLQLEERRIECTCETCWALRSGDPEYRPVGHARGVAARPELSDERWAGFSIPIGLAFFMREHGRGRRGGHVPEPGGRHRVAAGPGSVWAALVADNPELEGLESDAEGLVVNRLAEPPAVRHRADRRVLQAGRPGEGQLGGHLGRRPARGRHPRLLRGAARKGGVAVTRGLRRHPPRRAPELRPAPTFEILGAEAVRHAAAPTLHFAGQVTEPEGREVYTIALRAQIMIEPAKRSYDDDTRARLIELFGEPERWGGHHQAVGAARRSTCSCRPSPAPRPSRSRSRATTTSSWRPPSTSTRCPTATCRSRSTSRARSSTARGDGRMQIEKVRWDCLARLRDAGLRLARDDRRPLPERRLGGARDETLDLPRGAQGRAGAALVRRHRGRAAGGGGR